jgi:hypothetical protein
MSRLLRTILHFGVAEMLVILPFLLLVPVKAADPTNDPNAATTQCANLGSQFSGAETTSVTNNTDGAINNYTTDTPVEPTDPVEPVDVNGEETGTTPTSLAPSTKTFADVPAPADIADPGEGTTTGDYSVNIDELKQNPLFDQASFDNYVAANHGWLNTTDSRWHFCTSLGMDFFDSVVPVNLDLTTYLNTLDYPYDKIQFQNPTDLFALTGEPCTQFDPTTGHCSEEKKVVPSTDLNGVPLLDASGKPITEEVPKYYQDIGWQNGQWDAPKADARVLKTLEYLITPKERGGAGREHIKVGQILALSGKSSEFTGLDPSKTSEDAQDTAHAFDTQHPSNPTKLATALDITEIDNVRITTKIVEKHRLGGNKTTYKYQSVPIKVAWQTDKGVQTADLIGPNMYQGALSTFSTGLASLLDSMGLTAQIDLTGIHDVTNLGDITNLIGKSLLGQVLNSPNGSINGWDLSTVLDSIGRSYIAGQLGLAPNALSTGNTSEELTASIGRSTIEKAFSLPNHSLIGNSSDEIFANLGRRQIEDVLGVSEGTLLPAAQLSVNDFLERIGAGRIEARFNVPQGSMQGRGAGALSNTPKTKFYFTKANGSYVDEALSLSFSPLNGQDTDVYGFHANDYAAPTSDLLGNISDASFAKYKRMVGARAISSGIGRFSSGITSFTDANTKPQTQNFVGTITSSFGFHFYSSFGGGASETQIYQGPVGDAPGNWRITIDTASPILSSGAFTDAQILEIAQQNLVDTVKNTYLNGPATPDAATDLYNRLQSFWIPRLQAPYNKLSELLRQVEQNRTDTKSQSYQAAQTTVSTALGVVQSYASGLLVMLSANGQSGQSAALNLPGRFMATNADGTLTGNTLNNADPITTLLNGNITIGQMTLIGKAYASQMLTQNKSAQQTFISQIKTDLTNFNTPSALGIDLNAWISKGFSPDDFDRIFTKNLGPEVFQRVGEQQLLSALWGKTGFNNQIKNAVGSNTTNTLLNTAAQVAQGYEFYSSRFKRLQALNTQIAAEATTLGPDAQNLLKGLNNLGDLHSIDDVKNSARQYEPIIASITNKTPSLIAKITEAQQILREIAAGQSLDFNQSASSTGVSTNSCISPLTLRSAFGDTKKLIADLTRQIAACQVDDSLGLPLGSTYTWFQSKDYSTDGFSLAIGSTYAKERGLTVTDDQAKAYGKQVLEGTALTKLLSTIPSLGALVHKLGFSGTDIVDLLNGRGTITLQKMGASMLDGYFGWAPGTGQQLVNPTCNDQLGASIACTSEQAATIRTNTMVKVGLAKLGINLNFPSSFDLIGAIKNGTGGFDFQTTYGISRLSETFGLAPNSFHGTIADVRKANSPGSVLKAFGWYDTPGVRTLTNLATALHNSTAGLGASQIAAITSIYTQAVTEINNLNNAVLDEITNPGSQVWVAGKEATIAASLKDADTNGFNAASNNIAELVLSSGLDSITGAKVQAILDQNRTLSGNGQDIYQANAILFKGRIKSLDDQFSVDAGTFQKFITGSLKAEGIGKATGTNELTKILADKALSQLLAGTPFEELPALFQELTKSSSCPNGATLSNFILNKDQGLLSSCSSLSGISLDSILNSSTPEGKQKRALLYDALLSHAFGQHLEKDLNLEPGTIRAIVINPSQAREIAIDQGVRLVGQQLFKLTGADSLSTDPSKKMIYALDSSLLAGFCPVNPLNSFTISQVKDAGLTDSHLCTTSFDKTRSLAALRQSMDQLMVDRFSDGNKATDFNFVDLAPIFAGGLQGAELLGAATLAKTLNASIGNGGNQQMKIQYADIRNAFGDFFLTEKDYLIYENTAKADYVRDTLNCFSPLIADPACAQTNDVLINTYLSTGDAVMSQYDRTVTLNNLGAQARIDAASSIKQRALSNLQYNMYDIFAYKVDPSIPRGFSYAMLQGSTQQKTITLERWIANKLNLGKDVFDGFLTNDNVVSLVNYVANGYKGPVDITAMGALDNWLSKKSVDLFGFTMPTGLAEGIFAWGSTGFKGNTFDTSTKITLGGKAFDSAGTVLKNWGEQKLLAWADKSLGFSVGSSYQIYRAVNDIAKASQTLKFAHALQGIIDDKDIVAAQKAVTQSQANLAALVINTVFSKQIGEEEKQLGLVPGTGSMAVTILVQLLYHIPVDPVTLALFVGINLFGAYSVVVTVQATADGYYPYTGRYGAARANPIEYISPDPKTQEFDAMSPASYRLGLEHAAQYKVNQVLQDILNMPSRWAARTGEPATNLFAEQVYTGRTEDIAALDSQISAPAPWSNPPGLGYGTEEQRSYTVCGDAAAAYKNALTAPNGCVLVPKPGYLAGFFADPKFDNEIHIRF